MTTTADPRPIRLSDPFEDTDTDDLVTELEAKLTTKGEPKRPKSAKPYDSDPTMQEHTKGANAWVAAVDPEGGRLDSPTKGRHRKESVMPAEFMEQVAGTPGSGIEDLHAPAPSAEERRLNSEGSGRLGERKGKKRKWANDRQAEHHTWTRDELILIELRQERERRRIGCLDCGGKVYNKENWLCRRHYDYMRRQRRRCDQLVNAQSSRV